MENKLRALVEGVGIHFETIGARNRLPFSIENRAPHISYMWRGGIEYASPLHILARHDPQRRGVTVTFWRPETGVRLELATHEGRAFNYAWPTVLAERAVHPLIRAEVERRGMEAQCLSLHDSF